MKIYTLCGSMRFQKEMQDIAFELETQRGFAVLSCVSCPDDAAPTDEEIQRLGAAHLKKIDISDGIYVVNIDGYIGESVRKEIAYARTEGKEILYHQE